MIEYKIARTKKDLQNIYSFREQIYKNGLSNMEYKDEYDEMKRTVNFIALENNKVYANVRLIKGLPGSNGFGLPIEQHFNLSFYKKNSILPVEFSKLLISDNIHTNEIIIKFLTYVFQYADKHSIKFLCTLANTGTDDPKSIRIIYRIAQIKNLIHPSIQTLQKKGQDNPDTPLSPLYDKSILAKMEKYSRINYKILEKLEKQGLNLPFNMQLYTKIGFQATSIPAFILKYKKYVLPMTLKLEKTRIKNLKYDFNKEDSLLPKKEINCRNTNVVIQYVKSKNGDIDKLLKGISFSKEYLTDENNWIDCRTEIRLFKNARLLLNDKNVAFKIGYSSGQLKSVGIFNTIYKLFSSPLITYKMASTFSQLWNRVQTFKTIVSSRNKVYIILSKPKILPSKDICEFTRGICAAMPSLWNLETSINEIQCVRKGAPHCKYEIEWEPQKSIFKRIYFSTIDKFKTLIDAKKILKQKHQLLQRKYLELKQKTCENINLNQLLSKKNIKLQKILNGKIKELEKIYKRNLKQEMMVHHKEKTDIMENLTGIIDHEIKSNISSVNIIYDKFLKENLINENKKLLLQLIDICKNKICKTNLLATLERISIINTNYKDINYSINNSNRIIEKSIELCKLILNQYSQSDDLKNNVNQLIESFYSRYKKIYDKNNIRLKLNLQKNIDIKFNESNLLSLIQNIVSNSYNALIHQKYNKSKRIEITAHKKNNKLIMEIKDNGPGIPQKYQSHIFEPFFTTSAKNLGLGLPFSMKIIKYYKGEIKFKSNSKGTIYNIYLPIIGRKNETSSY